MKVTNAALAAIGTVVLCAAPAYADTVVLEDPATFHVGADSSGGAGSDPNLISSNSQFFVFEEAGQDVPPPIDLFFAVPDYGVIPGAPSITSISLDGTTAASFGPVTDTGILMTSGDLYAALGLTGNASLSVTNLDSGESANGVPVPLGFELFSAVVNTPGLGGKDFFDVQGSFGTGTYIAPWGTDGSKAYTTQFTNVGLITGDPTAAVPEASTWAMMIIGLLGLGFAGRRKVANRLAAFGDPQPI